MTTPATVHVLPVQRQPEEPRLDRERRIHVLDWLATEIHYDRFVPDDIQNDLLDEFASPDLTCEQRDEFWDGALQWVRLREDAIERTGHPEDVLMRPGTADEAEKAARTNARAELSLVVNGIKPARGSHSPRGNAS